MEPKSNAENAEENSAGKHPDHLHVQQQNAVVRQRVVRKTHVLQTGNAQDREQDQVINIHEISQRTDDNDWLQDLAQDRFFVFHFSGAR
jgi:hypothetical protein